MRSIPRVFRLLLLVAASVLPLSTWAEKKQTVCTITINSADEQKTFRKFLPADKYDFVELVERGRKDWLASSCKAKVSCDVLIVSGHHGEGNVFFSDAIEAREHLPIAELERVSCSDSCPSLFANLKEVYLFGCNTLNSQPQHSLTAELSRSYGREGKAAADAALLAKVLGKNRGESSRDRMRLLFKDVPVIYGFSGVAPLGPTAAVSLNKYFQKEGMREVARGNTSSSLLRSFSQHGMVAASGIKAGDPLTPLRGDVCTFADDRLSDAQRVASVHKILQRPTAESRLLIDRFESLVEDLGPAARQQPDVAQALDRIAKDTPTRDRYLAFARDADEFPTRARMIHVAHGLGWLSREQRRDELAQMLGELVARKDVAAADVNLACTLNKEGDLNGVLRGGAQQSTERTGHAAVRACMGDTDARTRVLRALVSPVDTDVQVAQAYLRHRPIADPAELRVATRAVADMAAPDAQVRALDVLARHYISDPESVDILKQLYAKTRSLAVQNAIAGALLRADRKSVAAANVLPTLREYRLKPSQGDNMVDSLIARLQQAS
jgi:hypothetical protein